MTPTIRAIRLAWPACGIAALVPRGLEGVLRGNPDLRRSSRSTEGRAWRALATIGAVRGVWTLSAWRWEGGTAEALLGWLSGARRRVGYSRAAPEGWRQALLAGPSLERQPHMVETNLDLSRACGIAAAGCRPCWWSSRIRGANGGSGFAAAGLAPDSPWSSSTRFRAGSSRHGRKRGARPFSPT